MNLLEFEKLQMWPNKQNEEKLQKTNPINKFSVVGNTEKEQN